MEETRSQDKSVQSKVWDWILDQKKGIGDI